MKGPDMRILTARARDIVLHSAARRIEATVILMIAAGGEEREVRVRTAAPIRAPGGAPLKDRLIASAKLILAMRSEGALLAEAELVRPAA